MVSLSADSSEFTITAGPTLHLDGQQQVVGRVIRGLDVIEALAAVEVNVDQARRLLRATSRRKLNVLLLIIIIIFLLIHLLLLFIENMHSTAVESPSSSSSCVCIIIRAQGELCSDLDRVLVLNAPGISSSASPSARPCETFTLKVSRVLISFECLFAMTLLPGRVDPGGGREGDGVRGDTGGSGRGGRAGSGGGDARHAGGEGGRAWGRLLAAS